jgi:hypothetical protein
MQNAGMQNNGVGKRQLKKQGRPFGRPCIAFFENFYCVAFKRAWALFSWIDRLT